MAGAKRKSVPKRHEEVVPPVALPVKEVREHALPSLEHLAGRLDELKPRALETVQRWQAV